MKRLYFLVLLFAICAIQAFSYRSLYVTPHDHKYVRDVFDHSQWQLPISTRSIGDEMLYQVAGYDLLTKWDYFNINPEVPPVGKYLYGASILLFNNTFIISLLLFFFSIFVFYHISKNILKTKEYVYIATLLFASDLLVLSQMGQTMLDLPQLVFFILHIFAILKLCASMKLYKSIFYATLAGISLGLFAGTKIAFFAVIIVAINAVLLYKSKRFTYLFLIIPIAGITYVTSYLPFFLSGNSLLDFARAQKWMLHFYLSSKANPVYGIVFPAFIFGWIKGWSNTHWDRVHEWSILWPVYFGAFMLVLREIYRKKFKVDTSTLYISALIIGLLAGFSIVPFFARYFLLVIPLFIMLAVPTIMQLEFKKISKKYFFTGILSLFLIQYIFFLNPGPKPVVEGMQETFKKGIYQDFYGNIDLETQKSISRQEFWRNLQTFERNLGVSKREVTIAPPTFTVPLQKTATANMTVLYTTKLGLIKHSTPITLINERNRWKVQWDPEIMLKGYTMQTEIVPEYQTGTYGSLSLSNGVLLSQEGQWPFFSILPQKVESTERDMQLQLAKLTGINQSDLEVLYKANNQPDWPAEIGFLKHELDPTSITNTQFPPAVTIEQRSTRIYSRSVFKNNYFEKVKILESRYADKLNPILGGKITMIDEKGNKKVVISQQKKDGVDVIFDAEQFKKL